MDISLNEDERIDDLNCNGLRIIQNKNGFCFGIDSVLLANFAKDIKKGAKVIDLGTGTGIIATLLCGKTDLEKIVGVEVQEEVYKMAKKSIMLNNLESRFEVINENILNLDSIYEKFSFDVVVTNPPYKKNNTGVKNENNFKLISRHEITADLEDFINVSNNLLKDKGEFYMVHRPERLVDIMSLLRKYKLEPKNITFVQSRLNEKPVLILIRAVKNAREFLKIDKPLIIYKDNGDYTDEVLNMYSDDICNNK